MRIVNLNIVYSIASFVAKLKCNFSKKDRETVKRNLCVVIPKAGERELALLTEDVFINFGKYLVDFFWLIKGERHYLKNAVQFIGLENLDEALKDNRGCIIITGHFGNWELAGCALANLGYKINVVALAHNDPRINNLFVAQRKRAGINVIPIGLAKTECQKALHRNEVIAILGDRPYGDHGIKVKFFDRTTIVPRGAALFSIKNGSPIVLAFTYKEDTRRNIYKVVFEKPLFIKKEGPHDKQLKDITQGVMNRFEYYIKRYPSQWYMFNKVWEE